MMLQPATLATLEELTKADWFSRLGQNTVAEGEITVPITIVSSWKDAVKQCENEEWDWLLNECANIFRSRLAKVSPSELNTWNERIRAIKLVSQPLVNAKIRQLQEFADLSPTVEITLRWIVTMTLAEAEYVQVTEPGYLSKLSFWIVNGHFPCGWKGEFPNGNLIIY
ncbi:MAG: hypothetical protein QM796_18005 [Chthoniobacteraceae bacterium]